MNADYQRFILTEIVAIVQKKYKFQINDFIYETKYEYKILKPRFSLQVYTPKESIDYGIVFTLDFVYCKITRYMY